MMKLFGIVATVGVMAAGVKAQGVIFNVETNSFDCPLTGGKYCAATSLTSNIIIRCAGFIGDPENCRNQLFGIFPLGVKDSAPCYQRDPAIGDAACTFGGVVYPEDGEPFPIPADPITEPTPLAYNVNAQVKPDSPVTSTVPTYATPETFTAIAPHSNDTGLVDLPDLDPTETIQLPAPTSWPLVATVPTPLNGGNRALQGYNPYFNIKPGNTTNVATNSSSASPGRAINGTGEIEKAAPTVALFTGGGNTDGKKRCVFGSGLVAIVSFLLAN